MTSWRAGLGSPPVWRECYRPPWRALCRGRLRQRAGDWSWRCFLRAGRVPAIDHLGGRFAEEDFVRELAIGVGDVFCELVAFLLLARGVFPGFGDIEDEIELDGGANHVGLGSSLGFELEGDAGDLLDGFGVSLCDGERSGAAIERAGELLLGIELGLSTEGARQGDDFLNDGDFLFGLGVGEFGAVLRVGGEGDGSKWRAVK